MVDANPDLVDPARILVKPLERLVEDTIHLREARDTSLHDGQRSFRNNCGSAAQGGPEN